MFDTTNTEVYPIQIRKTAIKDLCFVHFLLRRNYTKIKNAFIELPRRVAELCTVIDKNLAFTFFLPELVNQKVGYYV